MKSRAYCSYPGFTERKSSHNNWLSNYSLRVKGEEICKCHKIYLLNSINTIEGKISIKHLSILYTTPLFSIDTNTKPQLISRLIKNIVCIKKFNRVRPCPLPYQM